MRRFESENGECMKKLLAVSLVIISGCDKTQDRKPPSTGYIVAQDYLGGICYKYILDGHEYFVYSRGGIIHSVSCTNASHGSNVAGLNVSLTKGFTLSDDIQESYRTSSVFVVSNRIVFPK